jgi:hypothetical protein
MFQHRIDMRQTGLWTIVHGNGHGTIELYNRLRLNSYQSVVGPNPYLFSFRRTTPAPASLAANQSFTLTFPQPHCDI